MNYLMNSGAHIKAISYFLPEREILNTELNGQLENSVSEFDFKMIGIESRRYVDKHTTACDLAYSAALKLFAEHHLDKNDIDALIYCSVHQNHITPPNSCILQGRLNLSEDVATYDIAHSCSGYIYGLSLAKGLVEALGFKNVLFLTSSSLSKYIYKKDKASLLVFGDGSSATLISAGKSQNEQSSINQFVLKTDGKSYHKILIKDGLDSSPLSEQSYIEKTDQFGNIYTDASVYMDGAGVLLFTLRKVPVLIEEVLTKNNLAKEDIDLFVFHQANSLVLDKLKKICEIPDDKFFVYHKVVGNTVASSIPIALCEAIKLGKAKKGDKILLAGFGTGLSWGGTVIIL